MFSSIRILYVSVFLPDENLKSTYIACTRYTCHILNLGNWQLQLHLANVFPLFFQMRAFRMKNWTGEHRSFSVIMLGFSTNSSINFLSWTASSWGYVKGARKGLFVRINDSLVFKKRFISKHSVHRFSS